MKNISLSFCGSLAVALLAAAGAVAQEPGRGLLAASADGKAVRSVARADLDGVLAQPIPPGTPIERITIKRGAPPATAGTGTSTVVYLNELPAVFLPVGINAILADDLETEAAGGGMMSFFSVNVFGAPGAGSYNITQLRIFDGCPGEGGNVIVDMLEGTPIVIPSRGAIFTVSFNLEGEEIPVPERFWVGIAFNVSDAGWVGGIAPQIGFSEDVLHVAAFPCRAVITGNPPPYNAMNAEVSILNAQPFFTAYESTTLTRPTPLFDGGDGCASGTPELDGCGDGVNVDHTCEAFSDDVRLIVPDCELHAIALKLAGVGGGRSDVEIELWTDVNDLPGEPIPGTRGCGSFANDGFLRKIFFDYEPGVFVPRNVWVVLMDNSAVSGPVIAGSPPEIGSSQNYIAVYNRSTGSWLPITFDGDCPRDGGIPCGIYLMSIRCLGEEPLGACCDRISGTCTDNTRVRRCEGSWEPEATCADQPFEVACGLQGCCERDEISPDGVSCSNQSVADCLDASGEPRDDGRPCSAPAAQECGIPECVGATGSCLQGHGGLGCNDNDCCNDVCNLDAFCCEVEFDEQCRDLALDVASAPACGRIPPANNRCAEAIDVTLGITPFTTMNATRDGAPLPIECDSFGSVTIGGDVWFRFLAPASGTLTVDLCSGTSYDSRMAVYEGDTCPTTSLIGCDDDGCGGSAFQSRLQVPVSSGTPYLIRVGGFGDSQGTGMMALSIDIQSCPDMDPTEFVDPQSGAVDARQPHPIENQTIAQGIQSFVVETTPGAAGFCFTDCETHADPIQNAIDSVVEGPPGTYLLTMVRPLTTGAVTTINYNGTSRRDRGVFTAHPGNVNGDMFSNSNDVNALVNCLNGVDTMIHCPFGALSWDINHDEELGSSDLTRLIEVLIGSGPYDAWMGTPRPSDAACP